MYNPDWIPFRTEQECREYLAIDPNMDWSRRTGRTVRALKQAYDLALEGKQVFFVVPSTPMIREVKDDVEGLFGSKPKNLFLINVVPNDEWKSKLRYKTAGRLDLEVVFDHFFWECLEDFYRKQLRR